MLMRPWARYWTPSSPKRRWRAVEGHYLAGIWSLTLTWRSQRVTNVATVHPVEDMYVHTKCHDGPFNSCWDISVQTVLQHFWKHLFSQTLRGKCITSQGSICVQTLFQGPHLRTDILVVTHHLLQNGKTVRVVGREVTDKGSATLTLVY